MFAYIPEHIKQLMCKEEYSEQMGGLGFEPRTFPAPKAGAIVQTMRAAQLNLVVYTIPQRPERDLNPRPTRDRGT